VIAGNSCTKNVHTIPGENRCFKYNTRWDQTLHVHTIPGENMFYAHTPDEIMHFKYNSRWEQVLCVHTTATVFKSKEML